MLLHVCNYKILAIIIYDKIIEVSLEVILKANVHKIKGYRFLFLQGFTVLISLYSSH